MLEGGEEKSHTVVKFSLFHCNGILLGISSD